MRVLSKLSFKIVSAISYLHSRSILHRDIKDENVIINEHFDVKLIDFGSAADYCPGKTFNTFFGTIEYCSPEVLEGNPYEGPELEMWSLGVLLFVLLFNENPFQNVEETIRAELRLPNVQLTDDCVNVLKLMMAKDPKKRLSIKEVLEEPWVKQRIDITQYKFGDIIPCCKFFPTKMNCLLLEKSKIASNCYNYVTKICHMYTCMSLFVSAQTELYPPHYYVDPDSSHLSNDNASFGSEINSSLHWTPSSMNGSSVNVVNLAV